LFGNLVGEDLGPEEDAGRNDRNLFRQLQTNDVTEEELVRQVAERYKNYGQTVDETELEGTDLDIARQSMLPVVGKDPSLFQIKCRVRLTESGKYFRFYLILHTLCIIRLVARRRSSSHL
jgi:hypothetical protein